jgi:poly-gamma-glutamate capsule biosynthesis protein CapA/YwtB (metallophosphatase superfamily)
MKKILYSLIIALFTIIIFSACNTSGGNDAKDKFLISAIPADHKTGNSGDSGDYGNIYPREAWDTIIGDVNIFSFFKLFWNFPTDTGTDTGTSTDTGTDTDSGTTSTSDTVKLVFTGDVMLGRKVKTAVTNSGGNYQFPFFYVFNYLKSADLAVVNLESVITNTGTTNPFLVLLGSVFRADPAAINGLIFAGIDVVNVANDHAFDYGREGFDDSIARLKAAGITVIGGGTLDEAYTPKIITIKGVKIALLGTTLVGIEYVMRAQQNDTTQGLTAQTGVAWFYSKYMEPAIVSAKQQADIVIVSFHDGTENSTLPNAYQDRYAHYCIDQGANLVIGHHPGMIQPVMEYQQGYIAHSLGNFVYDQGNANNKKGMVLEVIIQDKKISQVNRRYVQINGNYQPVLQ